MTSKIVKNVNCNGTLRTIAFQRKGYVAYACTDNCITICVDLEPYTYTGEVYYIAFCGVWAIRGASSQEVFAKAVKKFWP